MRQKGAKEGAKGDMDGMLTPLQQEQKKACGQSPMALTYHAMSQLPPEVSLQKVYMHAT